MYNNFNVNMNKYITKLIENYLRKQIYFFNQKIKKLCDFSIL